MAKPSAFRILSVLDTRELNKLLVYLQSKFFSTAKELAPALKAWRALRGKPLDKEAIFKKAKPQRKFNKRDWYLLVSRLQTATESFLSLRYLEEDQAQQQLFLLRALRRLQLPVFFERTFRQAQKNAAKDQKSDAQHLLWEYQLELEYYDYIASPKRGERTNLQAATDKLDHFFMAEKLRHACLAHSRWLANQEEYHIRYLDVVLADLEERPALFQVPAIVMYASCYQAIAEGGEEEDFRRLRRVLTHVQEAFPPAEIRDVYLLAINYCIRAMHEGRTELIAETQSLYQESLAGGYLLEDGELPGSTFTNIVALGLKLENYVGIKTFIDTYASELPGPEREPVTYFNLARLFHAQEQYKASLRAILKVDTKDPYLYLGAKSLQVRVFIELEEVEALGRLLEEVRVYLQVRDDLGYRGENYQQFLQFCQRLRQLYVGDLVAREQLVADIEAAPNFAEKEWLLGKVLGG
jgi:hypothetical protein